MHPDSSPSFAVNINTGQWLCRSASCGARGGDAASLVAKLEKIKYGEAARIVNSPTPLASPGDIDALIKGFKKPAKAKMAAPVLPENVPASECYPDYLISRGYPKECGVAEAWDLRVCTRPDPFYKDKYVGYLILPIYDHNGVFVSFTARYMGTDKKRIRYTGPTFDLKDYLYGEWQLAPTGSIFVVEGQFDAMRIWTFGDCALGTFGTSCTPAQIKRLGNLSSGRDLVVCYDADAIKKDSLGLLSNSAPMKLVSTLRTQGIKCAMLDLSSFGFKDPDSLGSRDWRGLRDTAIL
jgi:hypothetical protein